MSKIGKPIPGRVWSAATDGIVTGADSILDDAKQKNQQQINSETDAHLGTHDTEIADRYTKLEVYNKEESYNKEQVNNLISRTPETDVVVLDVRTAAEYAEGHIEGAVLIDQGQNDFIEQAKATLPKDKTIAVYCRSGRRSANAAGRLADIGYRCVNLKGGIIAWKEANKKIRN